MSNFSTQRLLVDRVTEYVKQFMKSYDGSHDFHHIERVLVLALRIANATPGAYDLHIVTLCALLHDVGDRKYLQPDDDPASMIYRVLLSFGAEDIFAKQIQTICSAVSYNNEIKDYGYVQNLLETHPELGPVQDADRLDSIGAVGIARAFTYGGSHGGRPLNKTFEIFDARLFKVEELMKTEMGRQLARQKIARMRVFTQWFDDEVKIQD